MTNYLAHIDFAVFQKLKDPLHRVIYYISINFSLLIPNNSFAADINSNGLEAVGHLNILYFSFLLIILILLVTVIRVLKIYFRKFCWHCYKRSAMQQIRIVYKQGWLMITAYNRLQCRYCQHIKDVRKKDHSTGSSLGGGDSCSGAYNGSSFSARGCDEGGDGGSGYNPFFA